MKKLLLMVTVIAVISIIVAPAPALAGKLSDGGKVLKKELPRVYMPMLKNCEQDYPDRVLSPDQAEAFVGQLGDWLYDHQYLVSEREFCLLLRMPAEDRAEFIRTDFWDARRTSMMPRPDVTYADRIAFADRAFGDFGSDARAKLYIRLGPPDALAFVNINRPWAGDFGKLRCRGLKEMEFWHYANLQERKVTFLLYRDGGAQRLWRPGVQAYGRLVDTFALGGARATDGMRRSNETFNVVLSSNSCIQSRTEIKGAIGAVVNSLGDHGEHIERFLDPQTGVEIEGYGPHSTFVSPDAEPLTVNAFSLRTGRNQFGSLVSEVSFSVPTAELAENPVGDTRVRVTIKLYGEDAVETDEVFIYKTSSDNDSLEIAFPLEITFPKAGEQFRLEVKVVDDVALTTEKVERATTITRGLRTNEGRSP